MTYVFPRLRTWTFGGKCSFWADDEINIQTSFHWSETSITEISSVSGEVVRYWCFKQSANHSICGNFQVLFQKVGAVRYCFFEPSILMLPGEYRKMSHHQLLSVLRNFSGILNMWNIHVWIQYFLLNFSVFCAIFCTFASINFSLRKKTFSQYNIIPTCFLSDK